MSFKILDACVGHACNVMPTWVCAVSTQGLQGNYRAAWDLQSSAKKGKRSPSVMASANTSLFGNPWNSHSHVRLPCHVLP